MANYDVSRLKVYSLVPIVWSELPTLTYEDGNLRILRLKDYINEPKSSTTFSVHEDSQLPDGWRLTRKGVLRYTPVLGRTIALRFNAQRRSLTAPSGILSITRKQAFVHRLVPNRINLGLSFNDATDRLYVFNATTAAISPVRDFINSFTIDGVEQITEAVELTGISPTGRSGNAFDGTHHWICGHNVSLGGELKKFNADGTVNATYTYTGGEIESLTFDGTHIWGLDIRQYKLRKFTTAGVEVSADAIDLPRAQYQNDRSGFYFQPAQWGLTYADSHFWIAQSHLLTPGHHIFCLTTAGVRNQARDIETGTSLAGLTYNPNTGNLWWILDKDNPRRGILFAETI